MRATLDSANDPALEIFRKRTLGAAMADEGDTKNETRSDANGGGAGTVQIVTASIGAAAAVLAAMITGKVWPFSERVAIENSMQPAGPVVENSSVMTQFVATPPATAPIVADPPVYMSKRGAIYVANKCSKPISVNIVYENESGLVGSNGSTWRFEAGQVLFPVYESRRLRPTTGRVYYRAEADGLLWEGNSRMNVAGTDYQMRELDLDADSDGDYRLPIACDEPS